jgi:hypothetical protein
MNNCVRFEVTETRSKQVWCLLTLLFNPEEAVHSSETSVIVSDYMVKIKFAELPVLNLTENHRIILEMKHAEAWAERDASRLCINFIHVFQRQQKACMQRIMNNYRLEGRRDSGHAYKGQISTERTE